MAIGRAGAGDRANGFSGAVADSADRSTGFKVPGARSAHPELRRICRKGLEDPSLRSGQTLNIELGLRPRFAGIASRSLSRMNHLGY